MKNKTFYGTSELDSLSYMEFGSIDLVEGKKNVWDFRLHDKAYDFLMHARYSNDIFGYLLMNDMLENGALIDIFNLYSQEIYHKDDAAGNLSKLLGLLIFKKIFPQDNLIFFELGQTLFGCIEGMEFYQQLLKKIKFDFESISLNEVYWHGVDISPFFNRFAKVMHEKYTVNTMVELSNMQTKADVFFAKGVTLLYACSTIKELFHVINKGKFSIFDYSFSLIEKQETILGTGKHVNYLAYNQFYNEYINHDKKMYIKEGNSKVDESLKRVWVDCIYGEEEFCQQYIRDDMKIRRELHYKLSDIDKSSRFLNNDINPKWILIENYVDKYIDVN